MTLRSHLLAAVVGLVLAQPVLSGEPFRLDVAPSKPLPPCQERSLNQQLADTVADRLRQGGQLRNFRINIIFHDGVVELHGFVADQPQREEALRLVQGVPGVERVRDRLTVLDTAGPFRQTQAGGPDIQEPAPMPRRTADAPANHGASPTEPLPIFQAPMPSPYDVNEPRMPPYAWPTYAPYNNYSRVATPLLYPYNSWPFIGPCYPFPKIPLGWRSVKLEWQDGHWWYSKHSNSHDWWRLRYW